MSAFEWTEEYEKAFQDLKEYLQFPQILSSPVEDEELLIYVSACDQAISTVLVREEGKT